MNNDIERSANNSAERELEEPDSLEHKQGNEHAADHDFSEAMRKALKKTRTTPYSGMLEKSDKRRTEERKELRHRGLVGAERHIYRILIWTAYLVFTLFSSSVAVMTFHWLAPERLRWLSAEQAQKLISFFMGTLVNPALALIKSRVQGSSEINSNPHNNAGNG